MFCVIGVVLYKMGVCLNWRCLHLKGFLQVVIFFLESEAPFQSNVYPALKDQHKRIVNCLYIRESVRVTRNEKTSVYWTSFSVLLLCAV